MTVDINLVLDWFEKHKGALTYSMDGARDGSDGTADCSGALTRALYEAGASPYETLYSTYDMSPWLEENGFFIASQNFHNARRGDLILMSWGVSMADSANEMGHSVIMKTDTLAISVNYQTKGEVGSAVTEYPLASFISSHKPKVIEIWRKK